jgi:hypothetical protein
MSPIEAREPDLASEILRSDVNGGFDADAVEALLNPGVCVSPPSRVKIGEEAPIRVELGRGAELLHHRVRRDAVDEKPFQTTGLCQALVNEASDEADGAHFSHQRRVKTDLVDSIEDRRRSARRLLAFEWVNVDDDDVLALAAVDQWEDRWIAHITAVPIVFAINLDRLKHER